MPETEEEHNARMMERLKQPPAEEFQTVGVGGELPTKPADTTDIREVHAQCRVALQEIITVLREKVKDFPTVRGDAGSTGAKGDLENTLLHLEQVTLRNI